MNASFWHLFRHPRINESSIRRSIIQLYGKCPLCHKSLEGHFIQELASIIYEASNMPSVESLEIAILQARWEEAILIKQFEGLKDAIVYSVIRCPHINELTLYKKLSFAEMWSNDQVSIVTGISVSDLQRLETLLSSEWFAL
jgi:hypothetical protein